MRERLQLYSRYFKTSLRGCGCGEVDSVNMLLRVYKELLVGFDDYIVLENSKIC